MADACITVCVYNLAAHCLRGGNVAYPDVHTIVKLVLSELQQRPGVALLSEVCLGDLPLLRALTDAGIACHHGDSMQGQDRQYVDVIATNLPCDAQHTAMGTRWVLLLPTGQPMAVSVWKPTTQPPTCLPAGTDLLLFHCVRAPDAVDGCHVVVGQHAQRATTPCAIVSNHSLYMDTAPCLRDGTRLMVFGVAPLAVDAATSAPDVEVQALLHEIDNPNVYT